MNINIHVNIVYVNIFKIYPGLPNFKIPGSPSGRYSSDFGSPKINLTSPNKKI